MFAGRYFVGAACAYLAFCVVPTRADVVGFIPPPRNIADITAILDKEKPDPGKFARATSEADAAVPKGLSGKALSDFYFKRARIRSAIGRTQDAVDDAELAIKAAQGADYGDVISRIEQFLYRQLRNVGQNKRSLDIIDAQIKYFSTVPKGKGRLFALYLAGGTGYLTIGDLEKARGYFQKNSALYAEARSWPNVDMYRSSWLSNVEEGNAHLYEASGRFADAEKAYHHAVDLMKEALVQSPKWASPPTDGVIEMVIDFDRAFEGRAKERQARTAEAEVDIRQALLARLAKVGKYHPDTAFVLNLMTHLLIDQSRYAEAEQLARANIEIYKGMGYPDDAYWPIYAKINLAEITNFRRRPKETEEIYTEIDTATAKWPAARRDAIMNTTIRVVAMIVNGHAADAINVAKRAVEIAKGRYGDKDTRTMITRGYLAYALVRAGHDQEAYEEFKDAIPQILEYSSVSSNSDEDADVSSGARDRARTLVEVYISLLAQNSSLSNDVGEETYRLADVIRGQSVQRALSASSARAAIKDPVLAELARAEQDAKSQSGAILGLINNQLALSDGERDDKAIKDLQAQLVKLQATAASTRKEIGKKFPDYANLVNPAPATPSEVRSFLKPNEAVISFFFGRFNSYVWAISKTKDVKFATLNLTLAELEAKVAKLREALEPQATIISEIPPFDLHLAYELYQKLLLPVEDGWKDAHSLVVVTNGALGLLPLGLLPTAPMDLTADEGAPFSGYRTVPWLARTHSVTVTPSSAALRALRQLPPGPTNREPFIGFGDPYFNAEQAAQAAVEKNATPMIVSSTQTATATRGLPLSRRSSPHTEGVNSIDLGQLPRLPDTAAELTSIAETLGLDPAKVLYLGKAANEHTVETIQLSNYRIIDFATHGLVSGDFNGLTQPALALTAPAVAGVGGDGLLTMEKILALKLNADWVVLSACNTGAGAGAGAEAASGLGRAFFYAGTRALLVTNWSVHSQSARELVTDLFHRQAADPKLARGEALRQAMLALMDGEGFTDGNGKTLFTYAHPLFWAPFTIIGDGG